MKSASPGEPVKHCAAHPGGFVVELMQAIASLAEHPRPNAWKKLAATDHLLRIRVGEYRIVDSVEDRILTVLVVRIGHRREIYRHL